MNNGEKGVDFVSAPKDYASFFELYYGYVVALVKRAGIKDDLKEDVASDILLRFYERDFLNEFDPSMTFEYHGEIKHARFKSFLSKFVLMYVRGLWEKQRRHDSREVLICDMPVNFSNGSDRSDATWLEAFGPGVDPEQDEIIDLLAEETLIRTLRDHLLIVPRRSKFDVCDLVALFDALVEQVHRDGKWDVHALKAKFGVSSTAIYTWMHMLRVHLAKALGRPEPRRRPRSSSA